MAATQHRKTILVADDDPHIQEVLEARLASAGYEVILASDGREALDILARTPVDLVISDIRMPGLTGLELQANLEKTAPKLPIIFLTAYGSIQDAVRALEAKGVKFFNQVNEGKAGSFISFEDPDGNLLYLAELKWSHVDKGEGQYQGARS